MGELLKSNGSNRYFLIVFPSQTERKHFRRHRLNMASSCMPKCLPSSCQTFRVSAKMNNIITSIDSDLNTEEDSMIPFGSNNFRKYLTEPKPSTLEAFDVNGDSNKHPSVSEKVVHGYETGIHFIEERDEGVLSKRVLILSRSNKFKSAIELLRSMELSGLKPKVEACNTLISCLLKMQLFNTALYMFDFMKRTQNLSAHSYGLVLQAVAGKQGCSAAIEMFENLESQFKERKDWDDAVIYYTMISICSKENNWIQAQAIWKRMKKNNVSITADTHGLLVCIFARCNQNDLAIEAYTEILRNRLQPGQYAMQAMIGACAKEGESGLALNVFKSMRHEGLKPNLIACNTMINLLGKGGNFELAFKVYNLMKSLGHKPDSYTYTALMGALYAANRHSDAIKLFDKIRKDPTAQLNFHLFNAALISCQRLGLWERCVQFLWQMETSGLSVSTLTYNHVIAACEVSKKPEIALQIYEHMVDQKLVPDTFTYLSLVRSCIWGSLWDKVNEILEAAPIASLYNAAIHGLCLKRKNEKAKGMYLKMQELGLKADGKTRALMLEKLARDSGARQIWRRTHSCLSKNKRQFKFIL